MEKKVKASEIIYLLIITVLGIPLAIYSSYSVLQSKTHYYGPLALFQVVVLVIIFLVLYLIDKRIKFDNEIPDLAIKAITVLAAYTSMFYGSLYISGYLRRDLFLEKCPLTEEVVILYDDEREVYRSEVCNEAWMRNDGFPDEQIEKILQSMHANHLNPNPINPNKTYLKTTSQY